VTTTRLEAFSDGVLAIIITIMVLGLEAPHEATIAAVRPLLPVFMSYVLSFVFIGIYWSNHHHLFQAAERVTGAVLWANLHLLFGLSLIPFGSSWMGQTHFGTFAVAFYGAVLLMAAIAYFILVRALLTVHGARSVLAAALGPDLKGKVSILICALAIPLAFLRPWLASACFVIIAVIWLIPDRRIERKLEPAPGA
jgi:uncharacterized membrane protein